MLGGRNVIVEVRVEPLAWQRTDRTPGLEPERLPEYETSEADPRDTGADESEDVTEADDDGRGYDAPERPLSDEEPE